MSAEDIDSDNMDEDMDISGLEVDESLFWSMKLEPSKTQAISEPSIDGYIVHITNACFGPNVTKQSRTVVVVNDLEKETEIPVCVLRQGQHENHSLDLLFNEAATITLKGAKVSTVYLTGYIQPPLEMNDMNDPVMDEEMTEAEIIEALQEQKRQAMLFDDEGIDNDKENEQEQELELEEEVDDDDEDEDEDMEEEEEEEEEPQLIEEAVDEPPTKKQKTAKGSKSTKNGSKSKSEKVRKTPQQKPMKKSVDKDDTKEEVSVVIEEKSKGKNKKKKEKKKMQNMKGGIKYRDMKVGDGAVINSGDNLNVFYVGQTDDKKVFDKAISGKGFAFNYGKGDVIKGWDMGLKGMRIGGKRKLVIPPKLAYGPNGSPPQVPPNATLTFTIEIKSVN